MSDGSATFVAIMVTFMVAAFPALAVASLACAALSYFGYRNLAFLAFVIISYSCTRWCWYMRTCERWDQERWWPYRKKPAER